MRLKNLEIMKNWKGTKSPIHEDGVYCDTLNGVSNELLNESDQVVVDVYGSDVDEMNANTALVLDSFQTIQKCDLLPSELLQQRDELLEALKNLVTQFNDLKDTLYGKNHGVVGWHLNGDHEPVDSFFDDNDSEAIESAEELIKKIQP